MEGRERCRVVMRGEEREGDREQRLLVLRSIVTWCMQFIGLWTHLLVQKIYLATSFGEY